MAESIQSDHFGAYLTAVRKARKLSQRQAAEIAGVSSGYLSLLESGHRERPSADMLARLARAYGVEVDVLMRALDVPDRSEHEEPRRIEWAFEALCRDPAYLHGPRLAMQRLPVELKALLVEIYEQQTGRRLLTDPEREESQAVWQSLPLPAPFPMDLFIGLYEEAEILIKQGFVGLGIDLAVTAAEARLRELCARHEIPLVEGTRPRNAVLLAGDLQQRGILSPGSYARIIDWMDQRGQMPHGRLSDHQSLSWARGILTGIGQFLQGKPFDR